MARTFQGFGTSFVGQRDFGADGSYITTEWVVLFFVPVVPLRSFRVTKTTRTGGMNVIVHSKQSYLARKLPLHFKQVFCVYGFVVFYIVFFVLLAMLGKVARARGWVPLPDYALKIAGPVIMGTPFLVTWYLRSRAKKRMAMGTQI
jgi:hypothetical protein